MPRWQLTLLGDCSLSGAGLSGPVKLFRYDQAVLAYLALASRNRESRSRLATLLWGNKIGDSARHSLNDSISRIRKQIDDINKTVLKSDGEFLVLDLSQFDVDVIEFKQCVTQDTPESLTRAQALYGGDLLETIDIDTEEYEHWVSSERERLRIVAAECLARLSVHRTRNGDAAAATNFAEWAVKYDAYCERAHQSLMQLHLKSENRTLALRQAQLCEAVFREAGLELSEETRRCIKAVRQAVETPADGDPLSQNKDRLPTERDRQSAAPPADPSNQEVMSSWPWSAMIVGDFSAEQNAHPVSRAAKRDDRELTADSSSTDRERGPQPTSSRKVRRPWWWSAIVIGAVVLTVGPVSALCVRYWAIPELAPAPIGNIVGYLKRSAGQLSPDRPSIAVLPFNSYGDDDAADYAEAISDGSAAALSIASEMRVVPRSSVAAVVTPQTRPREIARQLGVRYLLEGTVGKSDDRVSVQIDLIDTVKDQRLVTETFDREGSDIIALQEAITLEVITSLQVSLTEGEQERINRVHRTNILDAWLAAARGEKLLRHLTPEDNARARDAYVSATTLDPAYAGAWEGLAWTYFIEARFGWTNNPAQSLGKAAELAQQTQKLDPNRARTYSLLGNIALLKADFEQAVELGEKAVELERNDADAAALLANTYTYAGEPERAINLVERAIKLRPYAPDWYYWLLGRAKRITGDDDEAISILDMAVRRQMGSIIPLVELAAAYGEAGNIARAKAIGARILDIYPGFSVGAWTAVQPYRDPALQERDVKALRAAGLPQ